MSFSKNYLIHEYKYDGTLQRTFEHHFCIHEDEKLLIFFLPPFQTEIIKEISKDVKTTKLKKYSLSTNKNPTFWFFWKDHWFNVTLTLFSDKKHSLFLSISVPPLIEEKALKYIELDLSLKLNSDNELNFLNSKEYILNSENLKYTKNMTKEISKTMREIFNLLKRDWFSKLTKKEYIDSLWDKTCALLRKNKEELLSKKIIKYSIEKLELEEIN